MHVVLILAEAGLAFAGEHPDHPHRHALDQNGGADRVLVIAEQVLQHGLAEQADAGGAAQVVLAHGPPGDHGPVADREVARRDALERGAPVLVAVLELTDLAADIADVGDRGIVLADRFRVGRR